jgi:hypothetical protein
MSRVDGKHTATSDTYAVTALHLRRITDAQTALADAEDAAADVTACQQRLRSAIQSARDADVTWMQIGDVLGIARGSAYQRYRSRPHPNRRTPHVA